MANFLDENFKTIDLGLAKFFHSIESVFGKGSTYLMKFISLLGASGIFLVAIGLILLLFVKTRKMGFAIILSILISALITSIIIKPLVHRARPYQHTELEYYKFWLAAGKTIEESYSFPSGHTTAAAAFSFALFAMSKNKKRSAWILLFPILMASSRIYLMVHYFSDCLGGIIVGAVSSIIAYFITKLIFEKTRGKFNNFINNFSLFKSSKNSTKNSENNSKNN